jgi:hypothetical protein
MLKGLTDLSAYKKELYSLVALLIVSFSAPVLPKPILQLLDNVLVNIVLILIVLVAITQGSLLGIMALMAVAMLYMERNRTKVAAARNKFSEIQEASDPAQMTVEQEGQPQDTVTVREFARARASEAIYLPGPKVGDDDFEAVLGAPELNHKKVLTPVPNGAASAPDYRNYLG